MIFEVKLDYFSQEKVAIMLVTCNSLVEGRRYNDVRVGREKCETNERPLQKVGSY